MSTRSKTKRFAILATAGAWIALSIAACASATMTTLPQTGGGSRAAPVSSSPPVLEDSFAVSSLPTGAVWNVFVQGSDPDGDMSHLWVVITQLGKRIQTETVPLVGPDQRAFSGYFTIYPRGNLFSPWENLRVEIRIRDRAGNLSAKAEHEAQIGFQTREMAPAKWAGATHHKLGTILFDLENDGGNNFDTRGR